MRFPQLLVQQFLRLTLKRDFAEAERLLVKIKNSVSTSDWTKGYLHALEGILHAHRTRDERYALINRLEPDAEKIKKLEEEFHHRSRNLIESAFDRGFFAAWADLARLVEKDISLLRGREEKEEDSSATASEETV